jgi:hypothetical protein
MSTLFDTNVPLRLVNKSDHSVRLHSMLSESCARATNLSTILRKS